MNIKAEMLDENFGAQIRGLLRTCIISDEKVSFVGEFRSKIRFDPHCVTDLMPDTQTVNKIN